MSYKVAPDQAEIARFLEHHWARPLKPQGAEPPELKDQGITLAPQSCATCHPAEFADWRTSLHSRSMGPGILGQLANMSPRARNDHQECLRCHAPLAEQADSLLASLAAPDEAAASPNRQAQRRSLHEQGLICASCHLRNYEWYGPPRRDGSQPSGDLSQQPHRGWKSQAAFESSQFCAACHQFRDDEYALNGKLLENTFREWRASRYAQQDVPCQSCHMPDRRHVWRGIHDPEMVRNGTAISITTTTLEKGQVASRLTLANTGVGHYFPTYVTPRVIVEGFQEDAAGRKIAGTARQYVIGRQVTLDLSREIADTRIAPDDRAVFDYHAARDPLAAALVLQVQVQPDAFYLALYVARLHGPTTGQSRRLISAARAHAKASQYTLFHERLPISEEGEPKEGRRE